MADTILEALDLPFREAVDFFRQKVRVPTERWDDIWETAHDHGFAVAGAAKVDHLAQLNKQNAKSMEQRKTLAEFRAAFDAIVERHGWSYNGTPGWRSRIIYETNLSTAYSAGRYAQLTDPDVQVHFPYWTYVHSGSAHPRRQHLAWNGLTLRADDAFWRAHYPPNGWRCGCRVSATSDDGLRRMGKTAPDKAPPAETVPWRDSRGNVHQVPKGIDPGFAYSPGAAWQEGAKALPVAGPNWRPVGDTET